MMGCVAKYPMRAFVEQNRAEETQQQMRATIMDRNGLMQLLLKFINYNICSG